MDQLLNHLELVGLDGHEEVAECEVAGHHILEDPGLRCVQALDEGSSFLKQPVDVLISLLLSTQCQCVLHFGNDQIAHLD